MLNGAMEQNGQESKTAAYYSDAVHGRIDRLIWLLETVNSSSLQSAVPSALMATKSVKFPVTVQPSGARFSVPKSRQKELGMGAGDRVLELVITSAASGDELFRGPMPLRSGDEIFGPEITKSVKPGQQIYVEASVPEAAKQADWSNKEVTATVTDYFAMLKQELEGQEYSKAAHRRALLKCLSNRSGPAVEFKHCNISAVLRDRGLAYIDGYKPRGNYQELLAEMVWGFLSSHPDVRKAVVEVDAHPVVSPPDGSQFTLSQIEVPPPTAPAQNQKHGGKPAKIDWAVATASSRKLGEQGEKFVRDFEQRRLTDAGRDDLAGQIEWVSNTKGDGAGFDIQSFDEDGQEIYIEVKTTTGPEGTRFYITAAELNCSEQHGGKYWLYRVFSFKNSPKVYRVAGPLKSALFLEPTVYRCSGCVASTQVLGH